MPARARRRCSAAVRSDRAAVAQGVEQQRVPRARGRSTSASRANLDAVFAPRARPRAGDVAGRRTPRSRRCWPRGCWRAAMRRRRARCLQALWDAARGRAGERDVARMSDARCSKPVRGPGEPRALPARADRASSPPTRACSTPAAGRARGTTRAAPICVSPRSTSSSRPGRRRRAPRVVGVPRRSGAPAVPRSELRSDPLPLRARARDGTRSLLRFAGARHARRAARVYLSVPRAAAFDDRLYRFAGYFAKYALVKFRKRIEHQQRFDLDGLLAMFRRRGLHAMAHGSRAGRLLLDERPAHQAAAGPVHGRAGVRCTASSGIDLARRRELRADVQEGHAMRALPASRRSRDA